MKQINKHKPSVHTASTTSVDTRYAKVQDPLDTATRISRRHQRTGRTASLPNSNRANPESID